MMTQIATMLDWLFAPPWLTFREAMSLSGWDGDDLEEIIDIDGVDMDGGGLIEKQSLLEFQEALTEVLNDMDHPELRRVVSRSVDVQVTA